MKKTISTLIFFCSFLSFVHFSFAGGGWPQPKGQGYFKISQSFLITDQYFDPTGTKIPITTTGYYASAIYGEYGLTDQWTVIGYLPLFARNTLNHLESRTTGHIQQGDELNGIGDIDLGIKYGFFNKGRWALSATLLLGLPTGQNVGGHTELMQTGDGEFNQLFQLEASTSFAKGYVSLLAGFNHRGESTYDYLSGSVTTDFTPEFRFGAEVGTTVNDRWFLALNILNVQPINTKKPTIESNGIFGNNVAYLSLTPKIAYSFSEHWGIELSASFAAYGKNILAGVNSQFGVFYKLQ